MYCTRCGGQNTDGSRYCTVCGASLSGESGGGQTGTSPGPGYGAGFAPPYQAAAPGKRLRRVMSEKKIAGVCAGFARILRYGRDSGAADLGRFGAAAARARSDHLHRRVGHLAERLSSLGRGQYGCPGNSRRGCCRSCGRGATERSMRGGSRRLILRGLAVALAFGRIRHPYIVLHAHGSHRDLAIRVTTPLCCMTLVLPSMVATPFGYRDLEVIGAEFRFR